MLELEPPNSVKIKGVYGRIMQTHGAIDVQITEESIDNPYTFHLVTRYKLCVTGFLVATLPRKEAQPCYRTEEQTINY